MRMVPWPRLGRRYGRGAGVFERALFRKLPPKSLDRNSFPQIAELVAHIE
jgi:hypothetical protein